MGPASDDSGLLCSVLGLLYLSNDPQWTTNHSHACPWHPRCVVCKLSSMPEVSLPLLQVVMTLNATYDVFHKTGWHLSTLKCRFGSIGLRIRVDIFFLSYYFLLYVPNFYVIKEAVIKKLQTPL